MVKSPFISCFLLLLFIIISTNSQQCTPYYPRMFYNPNSEEIDPHEIDLIFMWNTNISCPYSYIVVMVKNSIHKFRCQEKRIETFNNDSSLEFYHYIQTCSAYIRQDQQIQKFSYRLYGSKYITSIATSLQTEFSQEFQVQMPTLSLPLRLAVISDWGPILIKPYKPLNDTLDYILEQRRKEKQQKSGNQWRINGLLLNGDYAYNLETDHCQMYLLFLNEVSRISRYWPMIANVGNHESTLPKSMYLFENSFVIGRLTTKDGHFIRTQAYRFVNRTTFLLYDPFLQIYKIGTPQKYAVMKQGIKKILKNGRQLYPDEFMIMASHYPVMCSQVDPHCRDAMENMPDLFQWLSTPSDGRGLVDLYIGSHMHQYERIWPFVNNEFVNESSPYNRGRMASFVEAVGGVNYFIIEEYYKPQYFSVYSTYNLTGMGVITFEGSSVKKNQKFQINYKHIITPKTFEVVDQFVITNTFRQTQNNIVTQEK